MATTDTVDTAPANDTPALDLRQAWSRLKEEEPKLRIRDAARRLGVSEGELVATGCGENVTRLEGDWGELMKEIPALGDVMALTRGDHAVHERKGTYRNVTVNGKTGLVLDEEIDLRVFFANWKSGFAVEEESRGDLRRSLQFFDPHGVAVHKIYLLKESNLEEYQALVDRYRSEDTSTLLSVEPAAEGKKETPDEDIDFAGFYEGWRGLQDTHEFHGLLRQYNVSRTQALRHADPDLAFEVEVSAVRTMLETAAAEQAPIMVFVGSPGVIQIHTGPVENIVVTGIWLNVLDPRFNLHLREDSFASAWVVRKPTRDGVVTSLEVFDADGGNIAIFFGKRKPGIPEAEQWREIVAKLPLKGSVQPATEEVEG